MSSKVKGLILSMALLAATLVAFAAPREVTPELIAAEQRYDAARASYVAKPNDPEIAWQFARACFDRADATGNQSERASIAKEGIDACHRALQESPNSAAAHYYLGLDLAELAQTKSFGALHLLHQMEDEWTTARSLDPSFDYAGPDRSLGLLLRDAPGPPWSIGNRAQALACLRHALKVVPNYPENHLNLIETYLKWHQIADAQAAEDDWLKLLPSERNEFSGPQWKWDWQDWDKRIAQLQSRLATSPRHSRK